MKGKLKAIFTEVELYNYCIAEVEAIERTEAGCSSNWSEIVSEEYIEKFEKLSESQQEEFEDTLKKTAMKLRHEFSNLPDNIQTEEDMESFIEYKNELKYKVVDYMEDFHNGK